MTPLLQLTPHEESLLFTRRVVEVVEDDEPDDGPPGPSAPDPGQNANLLQVRSELDRLAREIGSRNDRLKGLLRSSVEEARAIGALLNEVADLIPHGHLEQWIESHCEFGKRMAQIYRQIDTHWDRLEPYVLAKAQSVAPLTITGAARLLGQRDPKPRADTPSSDARDEEADGGDGSSDPEGRDDRTDVEGATEEVEGRSDDDTRSDPDVVEPVAPACDEAPDPDDPCRVDIVTTFVSSDITGAPEEAASIEEQGPDEAEIGASVAVSVPDTGFKNQIRSVVELLRHKGGALEDKIAALHDQFCVEERAYQESKAAEAGVSFSKLFAGELVRSVADHLSNYVTSGR